MFESSGWNRLVAQDLTSLFARTLEDIASPGNGWSGAEKVAIANVARSGRDDVDILPKAGVDAATQITQHPSGSTESRVRDTVSSIGETRYVELIGVTTAITAIDTVTNLIGLEREPLPSPRSGDPVGVTDNPRLKRRSAWVSMSGPANPRHTLSAAPLAQATATRMLDRLYISEDELAGNGLVRGLTREQMEIVILKISHSNECFW